ncbi:MAG: hypothetical protein L6R41_008161 [Letrouitia leprolyta]|nr:MAG: hypothetical protein L6R41_008161 [Letrouitia leprolyta]
MSFPTTPVFVYQGSKPGFTSELTAHPAGAWLQKYTEAALDGRQWEQATDYSEWHTDDYTIEKTDGSVVQGGKEAWTQGAPDMFKPFKAHRHVPNMAVVMDIPDGYMMLTQANVYGKLHAPSPAPKVQDHDGNEWDVMTPGAFRFTFKKDGGAQHDGLKMQSTSIFLDTAPTMGLMLKSGMLKPEDLGK